MKQLHLGKTTLKELAEWFGKGYSTIRKNRDTYLTQLKDYCTFEELPSGKIEITSIKEPTFAGGSNRQIIKNNLVAEWNDNGLDTVKNVTEKIMNKHNELTITEESAYVYGLKARNELYSKPFCGKGELGWCEYVWCVEEEPGKFRELTEEEERKKRELLKLYFGDATEKQLLVEAMVQAGEITEEEAFSVLKRMTGMDTGKFYSFLVDLSTNLGCKVRKVTRLINAAW